MQFSALAGNGMQRVSSDAMAARGVVSVSEVLFLFFTGRGGSFLSRKEKEKNGAQKGRMPLQGEDFSAGSERREAPVRRRGLAGGAGR